jgi:hypothetical protein
MLTRILKDNGLLSLLLTCVMAVGLLVVHALVADSSAIVADSLSTHWAFGWCRTSPVLTQLLCAITLLLAGFITREVGIRFRLLTTKGWLPVLITVCVGLLSDHALQRPDILLGAFISQLAVVLILSTYRQDSVLNKLFHVGMVAGLAILLHGPSFLMVGVVLFSIFILRPGAWREWVMPFMGLIMLAVFVMLFLIWEADPIESLQQLLLSAWVLPMVGVGPHAGHFVLLVLLGISLPTMLKDIGSGAVQTRNGMLVVLSLMVVGVLMILFSGVMQVEAVAWTAFPVAIAVSLIIERATRWWWADLLTVGMLVAVLLGYLP